MKKPQRYLYDHGLPFSEVIKKNLDAIMQRIKNKKASVIVIDGTSGEGKTTLMAHLGMYYQKNFDFSKQIGMGGQDFMQKAKWCAENKVHILGYDEAGDFNKRGALTKFNMLLIRFFETYRTFEILPIIALPKFWVLDNHIFDLELPRILFHCHNRSIKQGNIKVYDLRNMYYMKTNLLKLKVKPQVYNTSYPNFRAHFLPLKPELQLKLDTLSMKAKKGFVDDTIIKGRNLVSIKDISAATGKTVGAIHVALSKRRIKAVETINHKNYYDTSIINILKAKPVRRS